MGIAGYVPAIGETDLNKIVRSIRNLYENGPDGKVYVTDTFTDAGNATIPAPVTHVQTLGYSAIGDGGGALYKVVTSSTLPGAGHFTSRNGVVCELDNKNHITAYSFGALGVDSVDVTQNIADAATCLNDGGMLEFGPGIFYGASNSSPLLWINAKRMRVKGAGPETIFRKAGGAGCILVDGALDANNSSAPYYIGGIEISDLVCGTEGSFNALHIRRCNNGTFRNITAPSGVCGVRLEGSLYNTLDHVSTGLNTISLWPSVSLVSESFGIILTTYNSDANQPSSHNKLIECHADGLSTGNGTTGGVGAAIFAGDHNIIEGGSFASNVTGIYLTGNTRHTKVKDLVAEGNTSYDFLIDAPYSDLDNACGSSGDPGAFTGGGGYCVLTANATGTRIVGGRQHQVQVASGCTSTVIQRCKTWLDISNSGTDTRSFQNLNHQTGAFWPDYYQPHTLTLLNGWADANGSLGSSYYSPQYIKTPADNIVMLRGVLSGASKTSDTIATLPAGFRPSKMTVCTTTEINTNTIVVLRVDTSGNVFRLGGSTSFLMLDGVRFVAEQ